MSQTEMDSLLARLSHDLADLVETQVASLSPDARKLIAAAVERGGCHHADGGFRQGRQQSRRGGERTGAAQHNPHRRARSRRAGRQQRIVDPGGTAADDDGVHPTP